MSVRKILNQVRNGDLTVVKALDEMGETMDASEARALARLAEAAEAESLFKAARSIDEQQGRDYRPLQINVACGLIEGGQPEPILEQDWRLRDLLSIAASTDFVTNSNAREAFHQEIGSKMTERLDEGSPPGFHELLALLSLKHVIQHLPSPVRNRFLDWFDPFLKRAEDNDEFMELDYPYGQVDPCIELARAYALAERHEDAVRWLEYRQQKWAEMMHFDELLDLVPLVEALPEPQHQHWWRTFREWAHTADQSGFAHEGQSLETDWLVHAKAPDGVDVYAALLKAVSAAELPQRLASILDCSDSPAVRKAAIEKTVELAEKLLTDVVESARDDWNRRAPAIRALRSAARTLDSNHDELSSEHRERVSNVSRRWAEWFAGYETEDLLPHRYTAIAFAGHWRNEVEPAASKLKEQLKEGYHNLLSYDGWERLFTDEELAEVLPS